MEQRVEIVLVESNLADVYLFRLALRDITPQPDLTILDGGPNTLERLTELHPDLVVSAWKLPFYSAPEFITAVRKLPALKDVPIAVLTTFPEDHEQLRDLGLVRWINKPIAATQLEDLLSVLPKKDSP
jgi:CheY-like chemotaxis protein